MMHHIIRSRKREITSTHFVNMQRRNQREQDLLGTMLIIITCLANITSLDNITQLEALRERRPPWPRRIITLILPTVKMLSLGCERLPPPPPPKKKKKKKKKRFWIITCTTIWVCYHYYGGFLLIYSSYNTQITTKI